MLLKVLKYSLIIKNTCVSGFSVLPASNRENKTQYDPMILVLFCVVLFLLSESGLLGTLHHSDGGEVFGEGRGGFGHNMV